VKAKELFQSIGFETFTVDGVTYRLLNTPHGRMIIECQDDDAYWERVLRILMGEEVIS